MRLSTLALATLIGSTSAFAPAPITRTTSRVVLNNQNNSDDIFNEARNVVLGTFTAATLFMGTLTTTPLSASAGLDAPSAKQPTTETSAAIKAKAGKFVLILFIMCNRCSIEVSMDRLLYLNLFAFI